MRSILRTTLTLLIVCGGIFAAFIHLTLDVQRRAIEELNALNTDLQQRLTAHKMMVERLGRTRRIAHVHIVDQKQHEGANKSPAALTSDDIAETSVLFIELDEEGSELARQKFSVPGDVLFIDAWTVKFDLERVAEGHPLMGRTLVLLRRLYSDRMQPREGFLIDTPGAVPAAYAVTEAGKFQQMMWERFWFMATDQKLARQMGVRVAQGEAVYKPVRTGQAYELTVDAAGGMNMRPMDHEEMQRTAAAAATTLPR